ncbi:hypothetical protein [Marinobacter sp. F3R11]|uniref:hypothetical protein n=1 Tax=Marinobacter sp. F3R11 TaxID=2267231 RepID=UPI000DEB6180|nr:hypothetical protein [Marinobacter sp. F3R11]RBW49297.1 hypothetical protein DS878_14400 [Marinobacter sp. F3R11]
MVRIFYFILACLVLVQATPAKPEHAYTPYFWSIGMAIFAYLVSGLACSWIGSLKDRHVLYVIVHSILGVFLFFSTLMGFAFLGKEFDILYKLLNTMALVKNDVFLVLYSTVFAGLGAQLTSHIIGRVKALRSA